MQHLSRTLDYLVEAKEPLEDHIYVQLRDLLNLRLNLVFYDVTSTYFEGDHCPLAEYGYSRDFMTQPVGYVTLDTTSRLTVPTPSSRRP